MNVGEEHENWRQFLIEIINAKFSEHSKGSWDFQQIFMSCHDNIHSKGRRQ